MSITVTEKLSTKLVLDRQALVRENHIKSGSTDFARFQEIADETEAAARPAALVFPSRLTENRAGELLIGGKPFSIGKIRGIVEIPCRVFPVLATCGRELEGLAGGYSDLVESYWLHAIMEKALEAALQEAVRFAREASGRGDFSLISPGSFPGWDIGEQADLFSLFGGHAKSAGISITSGKMLVPEHSLSGILVPCRESHDLCALCGSKKCPRRKTSPRVFEK